MNQANALIIANDTRLRGLALVLDPLRATETLQALKAIDAGQSLKLDYIRYKAGRRALALLHLVDPAVCPTLSGYQRLRSSRLAKVPVLRACR